eukprot:Opistho-2@43517
MPKRSASEDEDYDEAADAGSDNESGKKSPAKGKAKPAAKKPKQSEDDDEDAKDYFDLGNNKRLSVRDFKGRWFVDIREFYDANGEMKPGKKGIALGLDQWKKLRSFVDKIDAEVAKHSK